MSAALTTGLFTLLGVLIGGALNVMTSAWAEERRGRQALRTTARVIGTELATNEEMLAVAVGDGAWPRAEDRAFNFNAWEHYRHVVAERLSRDDWLLLQDAVRRLHVLERKITAESPRALFGFADEHREISEAVTKAREMLERNS